jgi:hypothetical protein
MTSKPANTIGSARTTDIKMNVLNIEVAEIVVIALQGDSDHARQNELDASVSVSTTVATLCIKP